MSPRRDPNDVGDSSLVTIPTSALALPQPLVDAVRTNLEAARAAATLKAYASDWKHWVTWVTRYGGEPGGNPKRPPATGEAVAAYVSALAESKYRYATLRRRLATISRAHRVAGQESPTSKVVVSMAMEGIRRRYGAKPKSKASLVRDDLFEVVQAARAQGGLAAIRDPALLLTGWAGAFRSDELVRVQIEDLEWHEGRGVVVHVRKSKTDQRGDGKTKPIELMVDPSYCAVAALRAWLGELKKRGVTTGAVFRRLNRHGGVAGQITTQSVTLILRRQLEALGYAEADVKKLASHSLRAGFVTQGFIDKLPPDQMLGMTGHTKMDMLLRYKRVADPFARAAGGLLKAPNKK